MVILMRSSASRILRSQSYAGWQGSLPKMRLDVNSVLPALQSDRSFKIALLKDDTLQVAKQLIQM